MCDVVREKIYCGTKYVRDVKISNFDSGNAIGSRSIDSDNKEKDTSEKRYFCS